MGHHCHCSLVAHCSIFRPAMFRFMRFASRPGESIWGVPCLMFDICCLMFDYMDLQQGYSLRDPLTPPGAFALGAIVVGLRTGWTVRAVSPCPALDDDWVRNAPTIAGRVGLLDHFLLCGLQHGPENSRELRIERADENCPLLILTPPLHNASCSISHYSPSTVHCALHRNNHILRFFRALKEQRSRQVDSLPPLFCPRFARWSAQAAQRRSEAQRTSFT